MGSLILNFLNMVEVANPPPEEEVKREPDASKKMKTNVNKNVVVRERDFVSTSTHQDLVTGIIPTDDDEFITSSLDKSIKQWDKFTQGVAYTIETHEPLSSMQITGEKKELLVCGLGPGHLIMFGKSKRN